ncbi:hypothetical protein RFI_22597 [Reticulomyxa filosa]|uniref:Chromatin target of PRMT1 protein C-terminal domain-containing protein n=1 Tax=Reticulomyxa filosa TaxID=46433 RepID=X6MNW5_RETFI|nr:hypothetical protein RFI_22597 [Reticulomyxa filosa]|eukprot:ETO14770.1 hypothetical protein RFI_22597 [Reticulomyxa filosa]
MRESPVARINADRKTPIRGSRGRGRGTALAAARGRDRGSATKTKSSSGGALTEKQLDRELERYYGNKDPQKLKEMKNDQLDREMDEYWKTQDENGHSETKGSKTDKAENSNNDNAQRNKAKNNTSDNVSKKGSELLNQREKKTHCKKNKKKKKKNQSGDMADLGRGHFFLFLALLSFFLYSDSGTFLICSVVPIKNKFLCALPYLSIIFFPLLFEILLDDCFDLLLSRN